MALRLNYTTDTGIEVKNAYVVVRHARTVRQDGWTAEGEHVVCWRVEAVASVYASKAFAEKAPERPIDSVTVVSSTNPELPPIQAAYLALRDMTLMAQLTDAQAAELEAMDFTEEERAAMQPLPDGSRLLSMPDALAALNARRDARRREMLGDKADGNRPFADALDV